MKVNVKVLNTIIRLVIAKFSEKAENYIEKHPKVFERLQTEDEVREWIGKLNS